MKIKDFFKWFKDETEDKSVDQGRRDFLKKTLALAGVAAVAPLVIPTKKYFIAPDHTNLQHLDGAEVWTKHAGRFIVDKPEDWLPLPPLLTPNLNNLWGEELAGALEANRMTATEMRDRMKDRCDAFSNAFVRNYEDGIREMYMKIMDDAMMKVIYPPLLVPNKIYGRSPAQAIMLDIKPT